MRLVAGAARAGEQESALAVTGTARPNNLAPILNLGGMVSSGKRCRGFLLAVPERPPQRVRSPEL
jgi:hypothetical protein